MIDIYCKDNICPICNKEMEVINENLPIYETIIKACFNGCFKIIFNSVLNTLSVSHVVVFKEITFFSQVGQSVALNIKKTVGENNDTKIQEVIDKVSYWKDKDKYLMKLLER